MIKRIVKLSIESNKKTKFIDLFQENQHLISSFDGCISVELVKDINSNNIFFTYSLWENENALNNYRNSTLFKGIWSKTKTFFCDKPEAWSLQSITKKTG
jgi:heme-degrading monooxygenase HmoA